MSKINSPLPLFADTNGLPLEDGYIYIGVVNLNPETNPVTVYWDSAMTQPAIQPLRTSGGLVFRNGSPAAVYINAAYSITVRNKNGAYLYSFPDSSALDAYDMLRQDLANTSDLAKGDALIGMKQPMTNAVARTVHDKLAEFVSVKDFGAVGDGITDDTAAIQAALNATPHGGMCWLGNGGRFVVTGDLTIPQYVAMKGTWHSPGYDGLAGAASFSNMGSVLLLDPTKSIYLRQGSALCNCVVFNSVIAAGTLPVNGSGAFSGTAIKMGHLTGQQSPDMLLDNVMILGFTTGVHALRCTNSKIRHVNLDCNNGILADTGGNPIDIQWALGWPILSVGYTPFSSAQLLRTGYGIKLQNNMDATRIEFCTFFDYNRGFVLQDCNGATLFGCGADAPDDIYSNGLLISGASGITQAIGCQFVANAVGIVINAANATDTLLLTNCYFVSNVTNDVQVSSGSVQVGGGTFFGSSCSSSIEVVLSTGVVAVGDCVVTKPSGNFVSAATSDNVFLNSGVIIQNSAVNPLSAVTQTLPVVAAANTMVLNASRSAFSVSGNTGIFGFTGGWPGRVVYLYFQSNPILSDSGAGSLDLAGNFNATAGDTITLLALSNTSWVELSRSVN
jgi:hypothetical protein